MKLFFALPCQLHKLWEIEKISFFFFPCVAVDILGHHNETHNTSERHFFRFSFLGGKRTAKADSRHFKPKLKGTIKGLGKILQAKQQRFFVLYEGEKSDIKAASKVPCGTLTKISNMRHLLLRVKLKNEWLSDWIYWCQRGLEMGPHLAQAHFHCQHRKSEERGG